MPIATIDTSTPSTNPVKVTNPRDEVNRRVGRSASK